VTEDEKKRRDEELDKFWDIDALIPKKRAPHYAANTETAEIVLDPTPSARSEGSGRVRSTETIPPREESPRPVSAEGGKRRFIPPHTADEECRRPMPEREYVPDNALIRLVRIYPWKSNYRYYEGFVSDAERLLAVQGAECPRVPFFSYVPQYSQMSRAQLEWYLWWRANLRRGVFLDTDYSYVLLYVYELINLSDRTEPMEVRDALCRVWIHYRDTFHQLDSYLPEWICDCSLLHGLPPPRFEVTSHLTAAMSHCMLKEFYVPARGADGNLRALLAFCSNYDYRKSKFCVGENVALYERCVIGALREVTERTGSDGKLFATVKMDDSRLLRDAYTGALCSYRIKRKIEVEYCSFSRSHELRYLITDVVKYTENKIRAALGIRSRLGIYALPTAIRETIDACLDPILPHRSHISERRAEVPNDYEKLYDLPKKSFSLHDAAEIERASWDTTERLIEAFETEESAVHAPKPEHAEQSLPDENRESAQTAIKEPAKVFQMPPTRSASSTDVLFDVASLAKEAPSAAEGESEDSAVLREAFAVYRSFLCAVRDENFVRQESEARQRGMPLEVLADEINACAVDLTGDILLEECDRGFAVIEDYRQLLITLTGDE